MVQAEEDRRTCEDHEYAISTAVTNEWEGGYNAEITITNLTTEPMEDWSLSCTCQDEITNVWNGILESGEATGSDNSVSDGTIYSYLVHGDIYNTAISAGESVTVGITANGNTHTIENCELSCRQVEPSVISTPTDQSYSSVTYQADVKITDAWQNGYNVVVTVTNISAEIIHNWGFIFQSNDTISNLYNAVELSKTDDNIRLIRNNRYNQDIPVGGSITFGYTASYEGTADVPSKFQLSTIETEVTTESYTVSTIIGEEWESGTVVQFLVENTSEKEIEDWTLEFDSTTQIQELWNGVILSHTGNHYIIQNPYYAQNIAVGDTLVVGAVLSCDVGELENVAMHEVRVTEASVSGGNTGEPTPSENTASENTASENTTSGNTTSGNSTGGNTVSENVSGNNVMVGIHYLSSAPGTGQLYYKEAHSGDFVAAPDGVPCVKNQFLISATDEVTFEQMKEYLVPYQAEIVGYIEFTNDYQVELLSDTPVEDIQVIIDRFETEPWVRIVGFNYIWLEKPAFCSTDPWYDEGSEDGYSADFAEHGENANGITEWDSSNPYGENWGLEAINYTEGLVQAGIINSEDDTAADICTDQLTTVNIGVLDNWFNLDHEDLQSNFATTWDPNNVKEYDQLDPYVPVSAPLYHGTFVSGIIGAEFNNGIGMNGICPDCRIYAYAFDSAILDKQEVENIADIEYEEDTVCNHVFQIVLGIVDLVDCGVKVINYSYALDTVPFAICYGDENNANSAEDYLLVNKRVIEACLVGLIDKGCDFLIVSAAGNNNGYPYFKSTNLDIDIENSCFGYVRADKTTEDNCSGVEFDIVYTGIEFGPENTTDFMKTLDYEIEKCGSVDARYANVFNYIEEGSRCYDHIICVGACDKEGAVAYFSNGGDRVDILAPGVNIYSCSVNTGQSNADNYCMANGTSFAAPYVTGTIGLAYNVDPTLTSSEIKDYIISRANQGVLDCGAVIGAVRYKVDYYASVCCVELNVTELKSKEGGSLFFSPIENCLVEIREQTQYRYISFGGVMAANSIGSAYVCSDSTTDKDGNVELCLREGTYYILINSENIKGTVLGITIQERDIGTKIQKAAIIERYAINNASLSIQIAQNFYDPLGDSDVIDLPVCIRPGWDNCSDSVNDISLITQTYGITYTSIPYGAYTIEVINKHGQKRYYNILLTQPFICYTLHI